MLALVQGMLPAVSVFFELGREASSVAVHGMRAFRIADILRHVRLQSPDQVVECLDVLTEALERYAATRPRRSMRWTIRDIAWSRRRRCAASCGCGRRSWRSGRRPQRLSLNDR